MSDNKNGKKWLGTFKSRLRNSTFVGRVGQPKVIPDSVLNFIRSLYDPNKEKLIVANDGLSDHEAVKAWYNSLWQGRKATPHATPVSQFQNLSLVGAITRYCTSEKYKSALIGVSALGGCIVGSAYTAVEVAQALADFVNSLSQVADQNSAATMPDTMRSAGMLSLTLLAQWGFSVGLGASNAFTAKNMSLWMSDQFKQAMFMDPEILSRIQHNRDPDSAEPDALKHPPGDVISNSVDMTANGALALASYGVNTGVTSLALVSALIQNAMPVEMLRPLGDAIADNGTAYVSFGVLAAYLSGSYWQGARHRKGLKKGRDALIDSDIAVRRTVEESVSKAKLSAYTGSSGFFDRKLTGRLDQLGTDWQNFNIEQFKFAIFRSGQSIMGQNGIAYIPALSALAGPGGKPGAEVTFQGLLESSNYLGQLIATMSEFINMLPEIADMGSHRDKVSALASLFELAKDKKAFYNLSGTHEFDYAADLSDGDTALEVRGLELLHRGEDERFLHVPELSIRKGDWVHIRGKSGVGKSCLLKALNYDWPYGRGQIRVGQGGKALFATQSAEFPQIFTLAEHVIFGNGHQVGDTLTQEQRAEISHVLTVAGLDKYAQELDATHYQGVPWEEILSGGEKQRLLLARILYQKPDLIFLDEPTAALDPESRGPFFDLIKEHCPESTLLAITHDENSTEGQSHIPHMTRRIIVGGGTACIEDIVQQERPAARTHPGGGHGAPRCSC